jgi:hypothetical protein
MGENLATPKEGQQVLVQVEIASLLSFAFQAVFTRWSSFVLPARATCFVRTCLVDPEQCQFALEIPKSFFGLEFKIDHSHLWFQL